jgi:hypothetical protein
LEGQTYSRSFLLNIASGRHSNNSRTHRGGNVALAPDQQSPEEVAVTKLQHRHGVKVQYTP